jgi:hypothetical protein
VPLWCISCQYYRPMMLGFSQKSAETTGVTRPALGSFRSGISAVLGRREVGTLFAWVGQELWALESLNLGGVTNVSVT